MVRDKLLSNYMIDVPNAIDAIDLEGKPQIVSADQNATSPKILQSAKLNYGRRNTILLPATLLSKLQIAQI